MSMEKSALQKIVHDASKQLIVNLSSKFTSVPGQNCDCGKPVVFIYPNTEYECVRCGTKWKLIVQVQKK